MATLYYGDGNATIEGSEIRIVHIRYRGAIEIDKTANDNFALSANNSHIIIFPIGNTGFLNDLFSYTGELNITSVTAIGISGQVSVVIKRVMDYSELLNTKSEDLTTNSENLSAGHKYKAKVNKTRLVQKTINNRHTGSHDGDLYKADGTLYNGGFHLHIESGKAMTGVEHSKLSEDLYIIRIRDNKLVPTGEIDRTRRIKTIKTTPSASRGMGGGSGGGGY